MFGQHWAMNCGGIYLIIPIICTGCLDYHVNRGVVAAGRTERQGGRPVDSIDQIQQMSNHHLWVCQENTQQTTEVGHVHSIFQSSKRGISQPHKPQPRTRRKWRCLNWHFFGVVTPSCSEINSPLLCSRTIRVDLWSHMFTFYVMPVDTQKVRN